MSITVPAPATVALREGVWTVDPLHTTVGFSARHAGIANVRGAFHAFDGAIEVSRDGVKAYGSVRVASVDTGVHDRDEHLRSADFFDAVRHPVMSFSSRSVVSAGDDITIVGDLTLRGVTRELVLRGEFGGADTDPDGDLRLGLSLTGALSRADYGMRFNQALGSGNVLVSDKIKLALDVSAVWEG